MGFMPDPAVLLAFAAASILLILTPGPDMTLLIGRALTSGRGAALACVGGTIIGLVVHTMLVALGVAALVVASPTAFLVLKTAGAAYLLWLAVQALFRGSKFHAGIPDQTGQNQRKMVANWTSGLTVNLLNPKIIIFFMTFLPQFVSVDDPHIRGKLITLGLIYACLSLPISMLMVLAAGKLSKWLKRNPRAMRILDYVFAGVFSAFAVRIFLTEGR